MRHNARRSAKGGKQQKKNNKMRVFDSNGPDVRIRGTAYQVTEKYEALAKDAETSGNYVLAENYRQHAEHYQRIINSFEEDMPTKPVQKEEEAAEQKAECQDDDLGLPASIVGEKASASAMATA
jgi:aspartokinase